MGKNHPLVFHVRDLPEDEGVYIGRGSRWGNPFVISVHGNRAEVVQKYREWLALMRPGPNGEVPPSKTDIRKYLGQRKLRCHCNPKLCHGHVLAVIANPKQGQGLFTMVNPKLKVKSKSKTQVTEERNPTEIKLTVTRTAQPRKFESLTVSLTETHVLDEDENVTEVRDQIYRQVSNKVSRYVDRELRRYGSDENDE